LCIQVTAENSSPKIKESLKKFNEYGLEKNYDRFVMLILTAKKNYSTTFPVNGITFKTADDIWDVDDLLKKIENLSLEKKTFLSEMLGREMRPLFSQFADDGSIFKAQSVVNQPAVSADVVLKYMDYEADSGDGKTVFKKIGDLYSRLSNLSRQARICLHTVISRGEIKHNSYQLPVQEYDNLLSGISPHERHGNFRSLEAANLMYADDGFIIAGWKLEAGVDFYAVASEILEIQLKIENGLERLVVDADFSLLD